MAARSAAAIFIIVLISNYPSTLESFCKLNKYDHLVYYYSIMYGEQIYFMLMMMFSLFRLIRTFNSFPCNFCKTPGCSNCIAVN